MDNNELEVFRCAVDRLKIKSIDAPEVFGVTRQTFSHWINDQTKLPPSAFVALLNYENEILKPQGRLADAVNEIAERIKAGEFSSPTPHRCRRTKRNTQ